MPRGNVKPRVLCVVTCGRRKIWDTQPWLGPVEARRAYTGPLARAALEYAERYCPHYVILSAKHGFLWPWEKVPGPYNVTFNNPGSGAIRLAELKKQAVEKGLMDYDVIIVLAGTRYARVVENVFHGKRIITPLKGMSMGQMISALKGGVVKGSSLTTL